MKLVLLLSGGMDSTAMAALLVRATPDIRAVGFDYGQRHVKELNSARLVAQFLGIPFKVFDLTALAPAMAGSALTSPEVEVPEGHYEADSMKATVVPNRNSIMANVAMGYALSIGYDTIGLAVHSGDHAIYPDCRPQFIEALQALAMTVAETPIQVLAPFLHISKTRIAAMGVVAGAPFGLTWSCYKGGERHCGKCGTCVERREAFQLAGISDPTDYER